jgi:hypothetical protein
VNWETLFSTEAPPSSSSSSTALPLAPLFKHDLSSPHQHRLQQANEHAAAADDDEDEDSEIDSDSDTNVRSLRQTRLHAASASAASTSLSSLSSSSSSTTTTSSTKAFSPLSSSSVSISASHSKWAQFLQPNETIIFSGLVRKRRGLLARKRQLLLTSLPRFLYIDPEKMVYKKDITWSKELYAEEIDPQHFWIKTVSQ